MIPESSVKQIELNVFSLKYRDLFALMDGKGIIQIVTNSKNLYVHASDGSLPEITDIAVFRDKGIFLEQYINEEYNTILDSSDRLKLWMNTNGDAKKYNISKILNKIEEEYDELVKSDSHLFTLAVDSYAATEEHGTTYYFRNPVLKWNEKQLQNMKETINETLRHEKTT